MLINPLAHDPIVLIAEDQRLVAESVALLITQSVGAKVGGVYASLVELMGDHTALAEADILLIDLELEDGHPSIAALRELRKAYPNVRCIWLSGAVTDAALQLIMDARLEGFVHKDDPAEHLSTAVRSVLNGNPYMSPKARALIEAQRRDTVSLSRILSDRELQVMELIAQGLTNDEISAVLRISANTAQTHRRNIMGKLGIGTTVALQVYAQKKGFGVGMTRGERC